MNNLNRFLSNNSVLNPQNIIRNINPQYIQSTANLLWDSANQYVLDNLPSFSMNPLSLIRETVTLFFDILPEDRLFLQHEAKEQLNSIINENKCKFDLNLSSDFAAVASMESYQLTIIGPPLGVQDSYLEIRQLLPITILFELKLNPNLRSIVLDPNAHPLQEIQKKHKIEICVVPIQSPVIQPMPSNHISIYIRTHRKNEENLMIGIEELTKFINSNNYGKIYPKIQTKIDIPSNQQTIIGRSFSMLEPIATKTSTQISVQKSTNNNQITNISIVGHNYRSISNARNEISDRFVVELNFSINGYQSQVVENFSRQLGQLSEESGVQILMKPNGANMVNKVMIVRGTDKEITKLFEIREQIFHLIAKPSTTVMPAPNGKTFLH